MCKKKEYIRVVHEPYDGVVLLDENLVQHAHSLRTTAVRVFTVPRGSVHSCVDTHVGARIDSATETGVQDTIKMRDLTIDYC